MSSGLWKYFVHFSRTDKIHGRCLQLGDQIRQPLGGFLGGLRGLGYSVVPMLVSLTGACLFRVVWIFSVFAMHRTVTTLYLSYPVSWIITFTAHIICYIVIRRRMAARRKSRDEI
mgnify:CR=1 FL=1